MADSIPATGTLMMQLSSFSGATSGVMVNLGSGPVSTGLISYRLDPSFGAQNFWTFNWNTGASVFNAHLLVTFPLLTSLGMNPVPILITDTGLTTPPLLTPGTITPPSPIGSLSAAP